MDTTYEVIVIGGGLAGLAAAATAEAAVRKAGRPGKVLVIDRQQPGGRATTDERAGYLLNRGAHALYKGGPGSQALKRLGVDVKGARPRLHAPKILVDGELQ